MLLARWNAKLVFGIDDVLPELHVTAKSCVRRSCLPVRQHARSTMQHHADIDSDVGLFQVDYPVGNWKLLLCYLQLIAAGTRLARWGIGLQLFGNQGRPTEAYTATSLPGSESAGEPPEVAGV